MLSCAHSTFALLDIYHSLVPNLDRMKIRFIRGSMLRAILFDFIMNESYYFCLLTCQSWKISWKRWKISPIDECKNVVRCYHITFYSVVTTIPHKEMESLVGSGQVFVLTTLSRPEDGASTVQVAVAGHLAELYAVLCVLLLFHRVYTVSRLRA